MVSACHSMEDFVEYRGSHHVVLEVERVCLLRWLVLPLSQPFLFHPDPQPHNSVAYFQVEPFLDYLL